VPVICHMETNTNIDDLPPPLPETQTGSTVAVDHINGNGANNTQILFKCVQQLQAGQRHQTNLIQELHSKINGLVVANKGLKAEIVLLSSPNDGSKKVAKKYASKKEAAMKEAAAAVAAVAQRVLSEAGPGQTPDEEIEAIVATRKTAGGWPVRKGTVKGFSQDEDLIKIRFHHSEKFQHIPVRIPKTAQNKDGTKPCKLCSDGKIRRKTTWMCATCEVPLCTRPLMDEDGSCLTHHTRWHSARDLVLEHKKCHEDLTRGRESRKRVKEVNAEVGVTSPEAKKKKLEENAAEAEGGNNGAGDEIVVAKLEEEDEEQVIGVGV